MRLSSILVVCSALLRSFVASSQGPCPRRLGSKGSPAAPELRFADTAATLLNRPLGETWISGAAFVLLGLLFFAFGRIGFAQEPRSAQSSQTGSTRAARHLAEQAVNAMGGRAQWSQLHSAAMDGREVDPQDNAVTPIRWMDDWQSKLKISRFKTRDGKQSSVFNQDDAIAKTTTRSLTLKSSGSTFQMARPHFSPLTGMAVHLPAVALVSALDDPHAQFAFSTARSNQVGSPCISIRIPRKEVSQSENIDFCFSDKTSLPIASFIGLPNLLGNNSVISIERVDYKNFRTNHTLIVPSEVTTSRTGGRQKHFYFDSMTANRTLTSQPDNGGNQ